ncbi:D-alanyl-D-alanine carboxypeptidase family protein [Acetivibrio cellulolyticus]|uniref:D-alanyl-D-alanine carboxypeptidase family protein n=1 Tax=Acetivibrio cellulolyticus TaxID=35830 RepID=UPI0001E2D8A8|nr:D-alanyl-D-alanine carboxypeptidase family protein [Acetivibrio cellulolyticus]
MVKSKIMKFLSVFLLIAIFTTMHPLNIYAEFESTAGSAILIEASTGQVLYEKNSEVSMPPASITKVMTLLLGFEAISKGTAKWTDLVSVSEKAWKMEGSKMFLQVGSKVSYRDIIMGISIDSANDGCIALAEYLCGSENAFVSAMNEKAKEIGLKNSTFKNCTGLPQEGHRLTAKDIVILSRYLIQNYPEILEIESKTEFTFNDIRQFNRNPLLGVYEGADGLKTGWTEEAGYCLAATAKQNGIRLIAVVLNTKDEKERQIAGQELLTYGFKNFKFLDYKKSGDIVDNINIENGKKTSTPLKLDNDIKVLIPISREKDLKTVISKNSQSLIAPINAGVSAGKLEVKLDGVTLASSGISTAESIDKAGFFRWFFGGLRNLFSFMW